eukprot:5623303-Pyramimonas_sp.AAC.1
MAALAVVGQSHSWVTQVRGSWDSPASASSKAFTGPSRRRVPGGTGQGGPQGSMFRPPVTQRSCWP